MKVLSILGVILLIASSCLGATWRVPSQFDYLQQAIVEADPGDTILVASGSYYPEPQDGDLIISLISEDKSNITILSELGKESTFLHGRVRVENVSDLVIQGFTVLNTVVVRYGDYNNISGCNIYVDLGDCINLTLCNAFEISNCDISSGDGNGIYSENSPGPLTILNNCIHNNGSHGIYFNNVYSMIITQNLIFRNLGHGIYSHNTSGTFERNTITSNILSGIQLETGGSASLNFNNIAMNGYGGVVVEYGVNPFIICNNVWGNSNFANGNYIGYITDQTGYNGNISVDPLFCDPESDDYSVDAASPVLSQDCGVMGALPDPGCSNTAVAEKSWGAIKSMYR